MLNWSSCLDNRVVIMKCALDPVLVSAKEDYASFYVHKYNTDTTNNYNHYHNNVDDNNDNQKKKY
ncbi:hypothetical protein KIN20_006555 [Parelaphostrongylus tenuis]|uniref:Uncharacterized protein n=1 Tax=Parelaphostrongylus tenuis TaxID=148309 RepID=A0AAD5QIF2_PARTN|nr:hypothetical protein KIN20_006555 [Parelaphostrongylus tenuis]